MKIRTKFSIMIAIPILAILGVFLVGMINFINTRESISDIVLLEADRINISEADRDSYQALENIQNAVDSSGIQEAESYNSSFEENADQVYSRTGSGKERFTADILTEYNNFEEDYNLWIKDGRDIAQKALNVVEGNKLIFEESRLAIQSFNNVRSNIDQLGELINRELSRNLSLTRRLNLENALSLVLNGDRDLYQAYVATLLIDRAETREELEQQVKDYGENLQQTIERVTVAAETYGNGALEILRNIEKEGAIWDSHAAIIVSVSAQNFDDNLFIAEKTSSFMVTFENMRESINTLGDLQQSRIDMIVENMFGDIRTAININIIILIVSILLSIIIVVIIAIGINRNIIKGLNLSQDLAAGDLTTFRNINSLSQDEIGELIKAQIKMAENFHDVVVNIMNTAKNVAIGSEQINESSQNVALGSEEQASGTEEVSSSLEEMVSGIEQTSENAEETNRFSQKIVNDAETTQQAVNETVEMMKDIAEKTVLIEEIAHQTNLLALNAAIEAARAGDAGKGFAVVANEVRKLAENSSIAAGEISELSSKSVDVSNLAGNNLSALVPDIRKSAGLMQEISAAMAELRTGTEQIHKGTNDLEKVVQANAAAAEELAATAEELEGQSVELERQIGFSGSTK